MRKPAPPAAPRRAAKENKKSNTAKKLRQTRLVSMVQEIVWKMTGHENFDPIVVQALVAAWALEGRWVTDIVSGQRQYIPPNFDQVLTAGKQIANYFHPTLKAIDQTDDADDHDAYHDKVDSAKRKLAEILDLEGKEASAAAAVQSRDGATDDAIPPEFLPRPRDDAHDESPHPTPNNLDNLIAHPSPEKSNLPDTVIDSTPDAPAEPTSTGKLGRA